jgi:hypothetical protein
MRVKLQNICIYFIVVSISTIAGYFLGNYIGDIITNINDNPTIQSDNILEHLLFIIFLFPLIFWDEVIFNWICANYCIIGAVAGALIGLILTGLYLELHLEIKVIRLYEKGYSLEEISAATGQNIRKISEILSEIYQPVDYQI